jgi:tRNA(Ile2) C34 agmatinyltransferase TiaS
MTEKICPKCKNGMLVECKEGFKCSFCDHIVYTKKKLLND